MNAFWSVDVTPRADRHHICLRCFLSRRQQGGEFRAALGDVLLAWKHLLLDKLGLRPPADEVAPGQARDVILEAYEAFLKRSNAVDLVHVLTMCRQLGDHSDPPGDFVNPVSRTPAPGPGTRNLWCTINDCDVLT